MVPKFDKDFQRIFFDIRSDMLLIYILNYSILLRIIVLLEIGKCRCFFKFLLFAVVFFDGFGNLAIEVIFFIC